VIRHLKNLLRLIRISFILAKHDALFLLEELKIAPVLVKSAGIIAAVHSAKGRPGERMVRAFYELGPTFIKLGQALSTRSDLLGENITADLAILQDKMPAFSSIEARRIIESELGKKIDEIFAEFDDAPVAAASIAQVHSARDLLGNKIAVKILRPGIEADFARDIEMLLWAAEITEGRIPKRLKAREVVQTFSESIKLELDLRMEAAAASEMAENFAADSEFRIPRVDWQRTSRRVLVTEWIEGISIANKEGLIAAGHDLYAITAKAASAMFKQILRDGFFHADMHPGNLFIDENGNIAAVDFGIMGRVDSATRRYLAEMLYGFFKRDYMKVAEVHFDAGYVPKGQSIELFAQACRGVGEPILGLPQNKISIAKLLGQLFKITEDFQMETQPQLLLLQKTMMLTEGIGRSLTPDINMWILTEPLIEDWARENMGAKARISAAIEDFRHLASGMHKLRGFMDNISSSIGPEGIKIHPASIEEMYLQKFAHNAKLFGMGFILVMGLLVTVFLIKH